MMYLVFFVALIIHPALHFLLILLDLLVPWRPHGHPMLRTTTSTLHSNLARDTRPRGCVLKWKTRVTRPRGVFKKKNLATLDPRGFPPGNFFKVGNGWLSGAVANLGSGRQLGNQLETVAEVIAMFVLQSVARALQCALMHNSYQCVCCKHCYSCTSIAIFVLYSKSVSRALHCTLMHNSYQCVCCDLQYNHCVLPTSSNIHYIVNQCICRWTIS